MILQIANLIADGILDIKIAFTEDAERMGMYHEKMGIISDGENNKVAFAGSMNESATAMTLNYKDVSALDYIKKNYPITNATPTENITSRFRDGSIRIVKP